MDMAALIIFLIAWVAYERMLAHVAQKAGAINFHMAQVRAAWMTRFMARDVRIMDTNLLGHMLNSASFFASTNLLLIAAAAGLLVGGQSSLENLESLALTAPSAGWLVQIKVALIVAMLAKGLLDFIWAIRQLNYALAIVGAAPDFAEPARHRRYAEAAVQVLNPAMTAFNRGVRAYYFALAATAWIISPWAMVLAVLASVGLLMWRQVHSPAAIGVRAVVAALDEDERAPPLPPTG
jgi:uncharacterized membrane protein